MIHAMPSSVRPPGQALFCGATDEIEDEGRRQTAVLRQIQTPLDEKRIVGRNGLFDLFDLTVENFDELGECRMKPRR